ncbi:MAG: hemolysin-like protein [Alphaproteobacteria bacterium]|nr:hemolysin-like protein [Alphaproteobacteria bacterium]HCP00116.1 hemolysin-like protein [Rhodospirillaceae bacterium]
MNDLPAGDSAIARQPEALTEALTALGWGTLTARLASSEEETLAAQALRYRVFYDEMKARPDAEMALARRDIDPFDEVCEHLLVCDTARGEGAEAIIATYRLLRGANARRFGRFYSASEYNIDPLLGYDGEILELGRSCVDADYRGRPTMQLLWAAIAQFVFHHDISLMFGCASMHGVDPEAIALPLSYLHHYHLAPEDMRPVALPHLYVGMNYMAPDDINTKTALSELPPLLKGYLRLGGFVGDGAVVDHQFNTTDVCIVVKTDLVTGKYFRHYGGRRELGPRDDQLSDAGP